MTRLKKTAGFWMGSLLACTWAANAQAQTCDETMECPSGFTCEEHVVELPCDGAACAKGETCAPAPTDCGSETRFSCVPSLCDSDADCGGGSMVCHEETLVECDPVSTPDCAPNQECPAPQERPAPDCTESKVKQCIARYALPCEADTDCGAGFECRSSEICSCSGSAGTDSGGAADAPVDAGVDNAGEPDAQDAGLAAPAPADGGVDGGVDGGSVDGGSSNCECHASELMHCELVPMECEADADCPNDFQCVTHSETTAGCAVPEGEDPSVCEAFMSETTAQKLCEPPLFTGNSGGAAQTATGSDARSETGSSTDPKDSGESATADAGVADDDEESAAESGNDRASAGDGCSVSGTHDGSSASWLALVMIALGLRSRRKQR